MQVRLHTQRGRPFGRRRPYLALPGRAKGPWDEHYQQEQPWAAGHAECAPWVHVTTRRTGIAARDRLGAELDGDLGVVLARSCTLAGLRRNAARAVRRQRTLGWLEGYCGRPGAKAPPQIRWHRPTRRYARLAGRDLSEIRRRWAESQRKIRRVEARLRRAGAYAREPRIIARGQVYIEVEPSSLRSGRLEAPPWCP